MCGEGCFVRTLNFETRTVVGKPEQQKPHQATGQAHCSVRGFKAEFS